MCIRDSRNQIVEALLAKAKFDLPEAIVANETRNVVYDIVRENQQRGVTPDIIEKEKEKIYSSAADGAKNRVKASFLFGKIADQEKIQVTQDELLNRISHLAQMSQTTPDKLIKDLQKRNGINQLAEQIRNEKVVDFLQEHAVLEDVKPVAA
jgi:trigger factor